MAEPVIVMHGVRTRDRKQFSSRVETLSYELGPSWDLVPVYWGDLGVDEFDADIVLPPAETPPWGLVGTAIYAGLMSHFLAADGADPQKIEDFEQSEVIKYWWWKLRPLRLGLTGEIGAFLFDVLVYNNAAKRRRIVSRVRKVLKSLGPEYGTSKRPISVIAHSLGGVVCFDLATKKSPGLWIKNFVTFGSQPSLFCLCGLSECTAKRSDAGTFTLPPTIERWTNILTPFDVLSFATERLFLLSSGKKPKDAYVLTKSATEEAHSFYWADHKAIEEIRAALAQSD